MIAEGATLTLLLLALVLDRLVGDPDWLWRTLPHPVVWFGKCIDKADALLNRTDLSDQQREKNGFVAIAILLIAAVIIGNILSSLFDRIGFVGSLIEVVVVAVFLAQKSLADHVSRVAIGLKEDGLTGGRQAVSMIVGRDPETLDEAGVSRAAIESLAENASDGVIAPAFWYAVFGLPGLLAYKMLNTADSMIGHKNTKYLAFGRASAVFDDYANWLPARLTGLLIIVSGKLTDVSSNFGIMLRDAKLHRSPNAGWPESGMAAVTGLALGGPRIYKDDVADEPFMNENGSRAPNASDVDRAIAIFWRAMLIFTVIVAVLAIAVSQ